MLQFVDLHCRRIFVPPCLCNLPRQNWSLQDSPGATHCSLSSLVSIGNSWLVLFHLVMLIKTPSAAGPPERVESPAGSACGRPSSFVVCFVPVRARSADATTALWPTKFHTGSALHLLSHLRISRFCLNCVYLCVWILQVLAASCADNDRHAVASHCWSGFAYAQLAEHNRPADLPADFSAGIGSL